MLSLFVLVSLFSIVLAAGRTTPPSGALTVGSDGTYSTVQKAVNALRITSTSAQSIFIYPGTYNEQVTIPALKGALTIYGSTYNASSYTGNQVTIQHSSSLLSGAADDEATGTLINQSANTKVYNINLKNTYGKGSQAMAVSAMATEQGYYGVGFYGYQDTVLAQTGNQVYAKCYIEGAVDFIFGQHARAWIDGSDIRVSGQGAVTASGRPSSTDTSFYVINNSNIDAKSGTSIETGSIYLGRPWAQYARVTVQNSVLSNIINSAGWEEWQSSDQRTANVQFQEYGNTGAGASGVRANFSSKATSAVTVATILGSTSWVDTSYLS